MKHLTFILLLFGSLFSLANISKVLSPAAQLRKLSLTLQGKIPTMEEFDEINQLAPENVPHYLEQKTNIYMNTPAFIEKMQQRLQELFRIKVSESIKLEKTESRYTDIVYNEMSYNALDQIFLDILKYNLSWDQLLLRKSYQIFDRDFGNNNIMSDSGFLKGVFPDQIDKTSDGAITTTQRNSFSYSNSQVPPKVSTVEAKNPNQKLATAGVLTTSRFFERYGTTKINKNRRRAAAVFRIFLCDEMRPLIIPDNNENHELLAMAFNDNGDQVHGSAMEDAEKKHGSDPACQACHFKLDPAGKTFMTSSLVLNPTPAAGALVYKRGDGTLVNIPVQGIGELAEVITQQPEYAQCQVKHFWNWFIGKDVLLNDSRKSELTEKFNSLGRKPNEFVKYLVSQPEFHQIPQNNNQEITLSNIKPIFEQCNECHSGEVDDPIPEFYRFPIGGTAENHIEWLGKITEELDLNNNGAQATMPPIKDTNWRLNDYEISLIKRWIAEGAKDDKGHSTLSPELSLKLIPGGVKISTKIEPTFDNTFFRYFENHDLFRVLDQFFGTSNSMDYDCSTLNRNNSSTLGVKNTLNGLPLFQSISPNYLALVQKCFLKYYDSYQGIYHTLPSGNRFINFSPSLSSEKNKPSGTSLIVNLKDKKWLDLSEYEQKIQISFLLHQLIGNGVLSEKKFDKKLNTIKSAITEQSQRLWNEKKQTTTLSTATRWATFLIITSEEFLTY